MLSKIAGMVIEDAPEIETRITTALQEGDASAAAESSHTLKGMLATFEQGPAVEGLQQVESHAKAADVEGAIASWNECQPEVEKLIAAIRACIRTSGSPS